MKKFWISFISLLMGVVIGVGIWHGIAYKDKLESFAKDSWDKIKSVFVKKDNNQPTEEQINLDGLYYINVNGDYSFVQIRDYSPETQIGSYGIVGGCMKDSQICLFKGWESRIEVDSMRVVEDDKYLHLLYQNSNEIEQIMIYDKASKTLYYDFSNGDQFPGETYEEQLLSVMTPFTEFVEIECQHETIMDMTKTHPTCTEAGLKENWCYDCNKLLGTEILPALGHNYVGGKCTRCGESDPNYVEACEHDWVEDLSYVPTSPSCGEYWDTQYKCSKCNETKLEKNGPLPHDYVNGVCSRCGESETTITTPEIAINDNTLIISNFDGNGTVNLYYRELGTDAWSSYVAGNVNEFDLTILLSRDWQPMERGKTYEIYVTFSNGNQVSSDSNKLEYIVPNGESDLNNVNRVNLSIDSLSDDNFWVLIDAAGVKDTLMNVCPNSQSFTFNLEMVTPVGDVVFTNSKQVSVSDFNYKFGVDKIFMPDVVNDSRYFQITITCDCGSTHKFVTYGVEFNHDGSHYLLTLSA